MRTAAIIIATILAIPSPIAAQTYYARQNLKQVKKEAAATPPPPVVPGTVSCSGLTMGVVAYPETQDSGTVAVSSSMAAAFAACNTVGAQYGKELKDYNYCRAYKASEGVFFTSFIKAPGVHDFGDNAYFKETYGNASCRYSG